jgi:dTMP kinase
MSGKFITVEGIEGVGKSSNIDYLAEILEGRGITVCRTREPGGTPLAERIRQMLLSHDEETLPDIAELLLFFAARSLHIDNLIRPALAAGQWVVCDRFTDASRAYQGYGRGLDLERINQMAEWVQRDLTPDLTLLLDAPAEVGLARAEQRGAADRLDSEAVDFYRKARAGYLALAAAEPQRFAVIDATREIEQVREAIRIEIERLLSQESGEEGDSSA